MFSAVLHGCEIPEQSTIDLVGFARRVSQAFAPWGIKFTWIQDRYRNTYENRKIETEKGKIIDFSVLSFNLGAPLAPVDRLEGIQAKPLAKLYAVLLSIKTEGLQNVPIEILGAGASGIELALGIREFLKELSPQIVVVGSRGILPTRPRAVQDFIVHLLQVRGIKLAANSEDSPYLRVFSTGFVKEPFFEVDHDLGVLGRPSTYAVGDGIQFEGREMVWGGVFPIRQAPYILRQWIGAQDLPWPRSILNGRPLGKILPPVNRKAVSTIKNKKPLQILTLGGKEGALGLRGRFWIRGSWVLRLKQNIDTRFVEQFSIKKSPKR